MAEMYPYRLDPSTPSPAEKRLFPIFKECLDDNYTVFHGKALQDLRTDGGVDDREIDYLVAHSEHGLLAIEIKGGQITIEGRGDTWLQNGKPMKKSPIKQVKGAANGLYRYLQEQPETRSYNFSTWYAVGLPDVDITGDLAADAPRAILLDKRDFSRERIAKSIEKVYQHYHRKNRGSPPGKPGIAALARKLAPDHFLHSHLVRDFEDEEQRIKQLTEEQYDVLTDYERKPRLLITGCAGSGKTMLAVEKTRRLLEADQNVLLTCFNMSLSEWLTSVIPRHPKLTIRTFHTLCRELSAQAGRPLAEFTDAMEAAGISRSDYFSAIMPNALRDAADQIEARYDAIIVDEGQDFRRTYWNPLAALLRDPDHGTFYIFCDDNQRIYTRDALPFTEPSHHLRKNLRNTLEIGRIVQHYHSGAGRYEAAGPVSNREPQYVDPGRFANKDQALSTTLQSLANENVPPEHIIILTPFANGKSHWKDGMQIGKFKLVRGVKSSGNQIAVDTVFAFKGLERPVVILTELDRWLPDEQDCFLYVALSRARNHLIVLGKLPERTVSNTKLHDQ